MQDGYSLEDEDYETWFSKWNGIAMAENINSFSGYLVDFQVFGRALSQEEMYEITTCKSFAKVKYFFNYKSP